jgi:hypothetical protein
MQPKNPIRVYHVGDKSGQDGLGVMTIATAVVSNSFPMLNFTPLMIAFAFCSPEDRFNAKEGRGIALERLMSNPETIVAWSGNSANDARDYWNTYMDDKRKPPLWKHRVLVNIPETRGLAFVDRAKRRPIRKKHPRNNVIVYVEGGVCMGAQASIPSAIALRIFDVDSLKEEGCTQEEICDMWDKITKNTASIL